MLTALTRPVSPTMAECALSFAERQPLDVDRAMQQHGRYCATLRELGVHVLSLPAAPDLPDAVFVEDTTVVVDELAVIATPLLPSRRREVPGMAEALAAFRPLHYLDGAATLEGGDVMRIDRTLYVGVSQRTNREGIRQLAAALASFGYAVVPVEMSGCLHLKSACTYIGRNTLLANPAWLDLKHFSQFTVLAVAPDEPHAANALLIGDSVVMPASFPRTTAAMQDQGFTVIPLDVSEIQKAEGGVTCCSVLFTVA